MRRFIYKYPRKNTRIGDYECQLVVRILEYKTINMNRMKTQLKDNEPIEIIKQQKTTN